MSWRHIQGPAGALETAHTGSGELAIVIGGGPGLSCDYLVPLCEMLGDVGLLAVCFHPRGMRGSAWPQPPSFRLADAARDVEAVRDAFGATHAHIVAHSFGGYVAWAALDDGWTTSLTLIGACSPSPAANGAGESRLTARVTRVLGDRRHELERADSTQRFLGFAPAYLHDPGEELPAALLQSTVDGRVARAILDSKSDLGILADNAARFRGTATVLVGESDPLGVELAHENLAALREARVRLEVIAAAGHFPWLESAAQPAFRGALERAFAPSDDAEA